MAMFDPALKFMLPHEGGWADDPADPGGATMHGITFAVAQKWGILSKVDLKNISDEKVAQIYKTDYWFHDGFKSQRVASKVFDAGVNMGPRMGIKMLQKALNELGATPYLVVDGLLGPKTLEWANNADEQDLLEAIAEQMREYYRDIVSLHPERGKFLSGWIKRANALP